jgi:hypothetical protein
MGQTVAGLPHPTQFNRGQLDTGIRRPAPDCLGRIRELQVEIRDGLTRPAEADRAVCGVERLFLTRRRRTLQRPGFRNSTHVLS